MFSKNESSSLASKVLLLQLAFMEEIPKKQLPDPLITSELGWLPGNVSCCHLGFGALEFV